MTDTPFATVEDLQARLDWTMDEGEQRTAAGTLDDLSSDARFYGRPWPDLTATPSRVRQLVLKAAHRHMHNPAGFTQSRAGDETLGFTDRGVESGGAEFTQAEIRQFRSMAGRDSNVGVISTYAWGSKPATEDYWVYTEGSTDPFPFIAADETRWQVG